MSTCLQFDDTSRHVEEPWNSLLWK